MEHYNVTLTHEDGIWLIEAVDLQGVRSYGRTVREAAAHIREAIAAAQDLEAWENLDLRFTLSNETAFAALETLEQANRVEAEATAFRERALLEAIDMLRVSHQMSYRDIAALIGLSHQRVAQLAREVRV